MKKKVDKIIALVIACIMVFSLMPRSMNHVIASTTETASMTDATEAVTVDADDSEIENVSPTEDKEKDTEDEISDDSDVNSDTEDGQEPEEDTEEDTEEETEEDVAFDSSVTCDGVVIRVTADEGVFPAGATLSAKRVSDSKAKTEGIPDAVEELVGDNTNIAAAMTFDVTVFDKDGNEIEPDNSKGEVKIQFTSSMIADSNFDTDVYHVKDEEAGGEVEKLDSSEKGSTVEAVTDGFSYYYVTFSYGSKSYKLERGADVMLEDITHSLDLSGHPILDSIENTDILDSRVIPGYMEEPDDYYIILKPDYEPTAGASSRITIHMVENPDASIYINVVVGTNINQAETGSGIKYLTTNLHSTGGGQGAFDVRGIGSNGDIRTTYHNQGYVTKMKVDGVEKDLAGESTFEFGKEYSIGDISLYITAQVDESGNAVLLTYTFDNHGSVDKEASVGSAADIQIGDTDKAPIYMLSNGIKMTEKKDGTGKVFLLMPVNGNFSTRWFGGFSSAASNIFTPTNMTELTNDTDSGLAWSWTVNVPAGGTVSRTARLIAGNFTTANIHFDSNGGTGTMDDLVVITNASTALSLNTFTREGYRFMGWSTDPDATPSQRQYKDGYNIIVSQDTTLYAIWAPKKDQTISIENDNITMTYGDTDAKIVAGVFDPDAVAADAPYLGTLSYEVDDPSICSVDSDGKITALKSGTTTVTVKAAETIVFKAASEEVTVTVNKKDIALKAHDSNKTYGDPDDLNDMYSPAEGYSLVPGDTIDNSFTFTGSNIGRESGENIGTYAVSGAGITSDKYNITSVTPGTLTITRKAITVKADNKTKGYGEEDPEFTATVTGLVGSDTVNYTFSRVDGENTGDYIITPEGNETQGNYTVSYSTGTLTITKGTLNITAEAKSKTYGESDPVLTYTVTGLRNGDTKDVIDGSMTRAEGEKVGTYAISKGTLLAGNYNIIFTGNNLTINKKAVTITAGSDSKVYDGTPLAKDSYTNTGLLSDDSIESVTITGSQTDVGTSDNVPSDAVILKGNDDVTGCYNITYEKGTLEVTKATITVTEGITAEDKQYDATTAATLVFSGAVLDGKCGNDDVSVTATGTFSDKNVGADKTVNISDLELTGDKAGNYELATTGNQKTTTASITERVEVVQNPDGTTTTTTTTTDEDGNEVVTEETEKDGKVIEEKETHYDEDGNVTKETVTEKDKDGRITKETETQYDEEGNVTQVTETTTSEDGKTRTVVVTDGEGNSINTYEEVVSPDSNAAKFVKKLGEAPDTTMDNSVNDLADMLLNDDEKVEMEAGERVSMYLTIEDISETVDSQDKAKIAAVVAGAGLTEYYDINLYKKIGTADEQKITETSSPINMTLQISDDLINTDPNIERSYVLVRLHEGTAAVVPANINLASKTASFGSDRFSIYAIVCIDKTTGSKTDAKVEVSKKTDDSTPLFPIIFMFVMSAAGSVFVARKRSMIL